MPDHSYQHDSADLQARLRRVEGQVRGIQKMIERGEYCVDILTQISAVISACEKVGLKVLEDHIRGCVTDAVASEEGGQKIEELVEVLEKFVRGRRSAVSSGR